MANKKTLAGDLLDITIGAAVGGVAIREIDSSGIPSPLKTGTSDLIGVGLLKGAVDLTEEEKKKLRLI